MNLHTIKNHKIVDKVEGPKPGLSADQFPAEVEDPITGKMKPVNGQVKDAADANTVRAFYPLVQKYVKRYLPVVYPSYDGDAEDLTGDVYVALVTPTTSKEDIAKLKEEDAKAGITHSKDWYRTKQTKYPKRSILDLYDPEKSELMGFASTVVKQEIIRQLSKDKQLYFDYKENKFKRLASNTSLDKVESGDAGSEEAIHPAQVEVDNRMMTEQEHEGDNLDKYFKRINGMRNDKLDEIIQKLEGGIASGKLSPSEQKTFRQLLEYAKTKRTSSTYGKGGYAKSKGVKVGGAEEYPFGVEPVKVTTNTHEVRLKFPFSSKQEAQEKADEFEDEMKDKGWVLHKVMGSSLVYKREE